jgi:ribosome-associated protein
MCLSKLSPATKQKAPPTKRTTATKDDLNPTNSPMRLDHFLKLHAMSETGGQAKLTIQSGEVKVNGEIETRRRRKLSVGDVVEVGGRKFSVKETPSATD